MVDVECKFVDLCLCRIASLHHLALLCHSSLNSWLTIVNGIEARTLGTTEAAGTTIMVAEMLGAEKRTTRVKENEESITMGCVSAAAPLIMLKRFTIDCLQSYDASQNWDEGSYDTSSYDTSYQEQQDPHPTRGGHNGGGGGTSSSGRGGGGGGGFYGHKKNLVSSEPSPHVIFLGLDPDFTEADVR